MFNFKKKQKAAYDAIMAGHNVCITGPGGVGKSYIIQSIRDSIMDETIFVAPTGIAALNIKGATIHKTFKLTTNVHLNRPKVHPKVQALFSNPKIKRLIIDEISMVRADVFHAMDLMLRYIRGNGLPFGGLQVIAVGDFYQLPPVLTGNEKTVFNTKFHSTFSFETEAWREANFLTVDLDEVVRQEDKEFVRILNSIRVGAPEAQDNIVELNHRGLNQSNIDENWIMLATTNADANTYNEIQYSNIDATGEMTYNAKVDPNVTITPVDAKIKLRYGTHVLIKANDVDDSYVNGDRGTVIDMTEEFVLVRLINGTEVYVKPFDWEENEYDINGELALVGKFTQMPIKYGWGITVHAAQGLTLPGAILNTGRYGCFADGQLYVALSRLKSLDSFCLINPINASDLKTSKEVQYFYANPHEYSSGFEFLMK